jgi:hypothetical protein
LAGGMSMMKGSSASRPSSPTPKTRTSVNPTSRAAMDAQYRTNLQLKQVRNISFCNNCRLLVQFSSQII